MEPLTTEERAALAVQVAAIPRRPTRTAEWEPGRKVHTVERERPPPRPIFRPNEYLREIDGARMCIIERSGVSS